MFYDKYFNYALLVLGLLILLSIPVLNFGAIVGASFEMATIGKFLLTCLAGILLLESTDYIINDD